MRTRTTTTIVAAVLALTGGVSYLLAQEACFSEPPLATPVKDVQFRIVNATFVSELQGVNARFSELHKDKYRGLVLTVEVKKAAGKPFALAAQDLTLHYRYGASSDVAKCHGLSTFSSEQDVDRAMSLYSGGAGRSATGLATTQRETVYVDMFFDFMEAETSDLHLFVAQPVSASFQTTGWK